MFLQANQDGDPDPFPFPMIPPSATPGGGDLIRIELNREWLQFVTGAATTLCLAKAWITDNEDDAMEIRQQALDLLGQLNTPVVDPPFYESDETADDEQLPDSPWYEDIADWVISAFLATTFTTGAAIVYQTTIPRLRLAFRTGDLGAIVRVLLNDLEIWTGSTNAPVSGLLEQILDVQDFAEANELGAAPWTLKILHDGAPLGIVARLGETTSYKLEVELGDIRVRTDEVQLRQDGCVLQTSSDGENWTTLYDPTTCVDGLIDAGIDDAIADGRIARNGLQGGPQAAPAAGECRNYHVILSGRDRWHCPNPVGAGDTIQISNPVGGWFDGSTFWRCPDGSNYVLGICDANAKTHVAGDPLNPGAYHMALVGLFGSTYFDPLTQVYTVPSGTAATDFFIQANDGSLSDNQGQVEFDVNVCSGAVWCYELDFTQSNFGFTLVQANSGTYIAGTGWRGQNYSSSDRSLINILHDINPCLVSHAEITYDKTAGSGPDNSGYLSLRVGGTPVVGTPNNTGSGNNITLEWNGAAVSISRLYVNINSGSSDATTTLKRILLRGKGVNPFGADNCT